MLKKRQKKKKCSRAIIFSGGGGRGAYHVGVWKFLTEHNWKPDLICGSSAGAVITAAIGSGFTPEKLINTLNDLEKHGVYQLSWWKQIQHVLFGKGFAPIMDISAFQKLLESICDVDSIRKSEIEIIITAVNIRHAELKFFTNNTITPTHVLASCSIPVLFPWQYIDGEAYWDGAVMMNTPVLPAIQRKVEEIIVVFLSPMGLVPCELPSSRREAFELSIEQEKIASYASLLSSVNEYKNPKSGFIHNIFKPLSTDNMKIRTVAPRRMLGLSSILNFSSKQAKSLVEEGYKDASEQLNDLFSK